MKKTIILFYFCITLLIAYQACATPQKQTKTNKKTAPTSVYSDEEKTTKKEKKITTGCGTTSQPLRLAGYVNYPPFGWIEEEKKGLIRRTNHGIGVALVKQIAKENNIKVIDVAFPNYKEAQKALRWSKADVLLATYQTNNRALGLDLIYPAYLANPFVIVSLKNKIPQNASLDDLKGKKMLVRREELIWPLIAPTFPKEITVEQVSGAQTAFKKLITEEADFMITSQFAAEAEARRFKITEVIDIGNVVLKNPFVFMAFAPGECNKRYKEIFQQRLAELSQDKDFMRRLVVTQVQAWDEKFKKEPGLLSVEADSLTEVPDESLEDEAQDDLKVQEMQNLDASVLIKQKQTNDPLSSNQ